MLVLCGLNSVCCITGREDQLKWDWDPPESTFKASQKSPSATEEKLYFAPFITSCQIWQKLSLPPKQWYFMLYFLCINWAGCPPMVRFQRLKRVGQSNMNCAFAAFNAVRHTISQKYSQKHFSAQHVLIDDVESFSLSKWRVLDDACYRCGRSCIMEMSWLLLSFTVFSPPAFFHGDIFMLSDHIFHQRS